MGKNNQARRAKKAKKRREEARRRRGRDRPDQGQNWDESPLSDEELILVAVFAGSEEGREPAVKQLLARPGRGVASQLARLLERRVAATWDAGWQPADVMRLTVKKLGEPEAAVVRCAIAADAASYEQWGIVAAPAWMSQIEALDAERWWDPSSPWPLQLQEWHEMLPAGIRVLDLLGRLPELAMLVPPPSQWPTSSPLDRISADRLPPAVLAKVRALLAKAESTQFEAEADSLTAKAQEMMTRHRIDRATVEEGSAPDQEVVGRRVGIDDPYPEAKALLLSGIADANGCRTVWSKPYGFSTVFGYGDDLDGVEELFTSLLVQATTALRREGSKRDRRGRSRTTRFRRSFLVAFATRIGQRLRDSVDDTVEEVASDTGVELVPILDARARAADDAFQKVFPEVNQTSMSATDWEGSLAGRRLGDEADLTTGMPTQEPLSGRRVPAGISGGD